MTISEQKFKMTSLKVYTRFAPQNLCILLGRVSTKVDKRIVKFQILNFLAMFGGGGGGRLTWLSMENYKTCDIVKMAGRKTKLIDQYWASGLSA